MPKSNINNIISDITTALYGAERVHTKFAESLERAGIIIGEEFGELCKEICEISPIIERCSNVTIEKDGFTIYNSAIKELAEKKDLMRTEALHVIVTCIRFLQNMDKLTEVVR